MAFILFIDSQSHSFITPLILLEDTQQALPDLARLLASVNTAPNASLLVVIADGRRLSVVSSQTLGEGLGIVVRALDQRLAGNVVLHVRLGRVKNLVVRAAGSRVDQTTSNTSDKQSVVNLQFHGMLELLLAGREHVVKALSLRNRPGETIQDETAIARQPAVASQPAIVR